MNQIKVISLGDYWDNSQVEELLKEYRLKMQITFIHKGAFTQEITWLAPGYTLEEVINLLNMRVAETTLVHSLQPSITRSDTGEMIALVRTVDINGECLGFTKSLIIG